MNKFLFLLFTFLVFSCVFVSGALDDAIVYYSFDDADLSGSNPLDLSGNNFTGTTVGATTGAIGLLGESFSFDGSGDYVTRSESFDFGTGGVSLSFWFYNDLNAVNIVPFALNKDANEYLWLQRYTDNILYVNFKDGVNYQQLASTGTLMGGSWYYVTVVRDTVGGDLNLYINGVLNSTATLTVTGGFDSTNYFVGSRDVGVSAFDGRIDEFALYDSIKSPTDVSTLFNGGAGFNPYSPVSVINDSTESTAVVKQVGSVSFSGGAFTTVLSSTFNVSVNDTPLYGGYSFNVESNGVNVIFCELLIDGVVRANVTRNQQSGVLGSVFIQTPVFLIDEGSYSQTLRCRRSSGVGLLTVSNADGIGHFLINQDSVILPYNSSIFSDSGVVSGSNFTLLDSFNITVGNYTESDASQNRTNHIVVESQITYSNSAGGTELLSAYVDVNGTNCSIYPRTVTSGGAGSVSMDCIISNVTANSVYTVNVWGNGSNAVYSANSVAKSFFLSSGEIIGGTGIITGYNFVGTGWNEIFNSSGGNINHDIANAFVKLSYSVLTNVSTQVDFYVVISDGSTFTTNTWSRDFVAGQTGVLIGHDILESLPKDPNYNITLFARCGSVGAGCTITGGSSLGYLTDVVSTVLNSFNVSAFDDISGVSISNFTVVNGGIWDGVDGSAIVFSSGSLINFTVSSDGYQSKSFLNHNISNDINVSLVPSFYIGPVSYDGFVPYGGSNYTNNVSYGVSIICPLGSSETVNIFVDGVLFTSFSPVCNNNLVNNVGSFSYVLEGTYSVSFNWSGTSDVVGSSVFTWDLVKPSISQFFVTGDGFNNNSIVVDVVCTDTLSPLITYNVSWVGSLVNYSNLTSGSLVSFVRNASLNNYVSTSCTDLAGNDRFSNYSEIIYSTLFILVDERTGSAFDVNNLSSVVVYIDDNSSSIDLQSLGTNNFSFTSAGDDILRFEYIYSDGFVLNRYFDMSLTSGIVTRFCAVPDDNLAFYEQLIVSSVDSTRVSLEASFADCVVLSDTTRFANQNAFSVRTFTIDTTYILYNYVDNIVRSILANIDGGVVSNINIDSIEFSSSAFNQGLRAESLNVEKFSGSTMLIVYNNTNGDNTGLSVVITRTDTGAVVYSEDDFDDLNGFVLYYDFSSLVGLDNSTLFRVVLDSERVDGTSNRLIRFFNTSGSTGVIHPSVILPYNSSIFSDSGVVNGCFMKIYFFIIIILFRCFRV